MFIVVEMDFKSRKGMRILSEFLIEARTTYSYVPVGSAKEKTKDDETRVIGPYIDGKMSYIDRYKGYEWFKGQEEISFNDKALWTRDYEGGIINEPHKTKEKVCELYQILKMALRNFPHETCFKRGPDSFREGEYLYTDVCKGDIVSFKGSEVIMYKNRNVYALSYGGGLIKI